MNSKTKNFFYWLLLPGVGVIAADQISKKLTAMNFKPNQVADILDQKWIFWTRLPNSGLLFQKFEMLYAPENALWTRYIPIFALLVTATVWLWCELKSNMPFASKIATLGFSLFWFGGSSNILSHCLSKFVDDTISARLFPGSPFFTFNLADLAITSGLFLFAVATCKVIFVELQTKIGSFKSNILLKY